MAKEFKTIGELVDLLESRGVKTDEKTSSVLQREGYYAIVNGYKDTFLDRAAMQSSPGDVYKKGTTFRQIYDLFLFDRELRAFCLRYLIEAEACMKNAVVYAFCEKHPEANAYLERSNYVRPRDMLVPKAFRKNVEAEANKNLADLMRRLNGKLGISSRTPDCVRHYLESYGEVPLWVLQNDLTFGNVEHFYQLQKRGVQNAACRIISSWSAAGRIGARDLLTAFHVLVGFRNICAHDDRLYCASIDGLHFDAMLNELRMVLPLERSEELGSTLASVIDPFRGRLDPRAFNAMYTNPKDIPMEYRD